MKSVKQTQNLDNFITSLDNIKKLILFILSEMSTSIDLN